MRQDPAVRSEAHGILEGLFRHVGESSQQGTGTLGGIGGDLSEFLTMPADLARLFTDMAFDLTEVVLNALAEGGVILVKGLTPM